LLVLIVALSHVVASQESALTSAADWAAIFAAVFAFLILVVGVGGWAWRTSTAAAIDHGLHVEAPQCVFEGDRQSLFVTFGLRMKNGSAGRAISYHPQRVMVRIADREHPLLSPVHVEDLAPGRSKDWLRDRIGIAFVALPARAEVEYEIFYGFQGGKMRRSITGAFWMTLPRIGSEPDGHAVWRELRPERDRRLSWRQSRGRRQ
jgi:hypothetical protein